MINGRMLVVSVVVGLATLGSFGGCGGDDDDGGGSQLSSCDDAASKICGLIKSCSPIAFDIQYASDADCTKPLRTACQRVTTAPGSKTTLATGSACVNAYTCASVTTGAQPAACATTPGDRAIGDSCYDDTQCQSTYCKPASSDGCGTCQKRAGEGESCATGPCTTGLVCTSESKCQKPAGAGESCTGVSCGDGLFCAKDSTCQKRGTKKVNEACENIVECDNATGYVCGLEGKCVLIKLVDTGETCGVSNGEYLACKGGGKCDADKCVARLREGEACTAGQDGSSLCVDGTACQNGTCVSPSVPTCK